jgi:hypothetical protein
VDLHRELGDRRRYERQIGRLHRRYLFTGELHELTQGDVSLATVASHRSRVARLLARTVRRGRYRFEPGTRRLIEVGGKDRVVYAFGLTDLVVHGVVADVILEAMTPLLSPRLYSYRKGVSWWTPTRLFADYIRDHRRALPDPRTRGLYVLRRDVDSYTDSIPVGDHSPVWAMIHRLIGPARTADWDLVRTVVRPDYWVEPGALATLYRGVPTGQPVASALFNLYLAELDHELAQIPGGFYARYSDDFLFAHPEPDVARRASVRIDETLDGLELEINERKRHDLYLTGAGRLSDAWPQARGTTSVPFLGTHVSAQGTVALNGEKTRGLLRELEERAMRTARAVRSADHERVGRIVCSVLNEALDHRRVLFQEPSATFLRRGETDRSHLAHVDYLLARIVVRAVTGDGSVRAFRTVPYRKIRTDWGLVSLVTSRNARREAVR